MASNVATAKKQKRGSIKDYFKNVKSEMKKVVWPTRKEVVAFTGVVLFICTLFCIFLWGIDTAFMYLIKLIFKIKL